MSLNEVEIIEQRRLARIGKHQSDEKLIKLHLQAVEALLDRQGGERVRRLALARVENGTANSFAIPVTSRRGATFSICLSPLCANPSSRMSQRGFRCGKIRPSVFCCMSRRDESYRHYARDYSPRRAEKHSAFRRRLNPPKQ